MPFLGAFAHAGPWGQAPGVWFTQIEAGTGHIQKRDFRTETISVYAEHGLPRNMTASVNHFASFLSNANGTDQVSAFNQQETRFALERRLYQWPHAAASIGVGHAMRTGFRAGLTERDGGRGDGRCPEGVSDVFGSFGYKRPKKTSTRTEKPPQWFRKLRPRAENILYTVETRVDLNGAAICRERRLNLAIIQNGKKGGREAHIWHTDVDETPNSDGVRRLSSTKYRILYRRNVEHLGSAYIAYTVEYSGQFQESSVAIGISRQFG